MSPRLRRRLRLAVPLALLIAAVPAFVVLASHQFSDVPNTHPFHTDIGEFAGAGITSGCGGGKFCPDANVTRGQMAAFMNRGLPRTALTSSSATFAETEDFYVAGMNLRTGGASGGTGYVIVDADVTAYTDDADTCPCELAIWIDMYSGATLLDSSNSMFFDVSGTASPAGYRNGAGSVSWVFEVPTRTTLAFAVGAQATISAAEYGTTDEAVGAILTATYVPFGQISLPALSGDDSGGRGVAPKGALRLRD